MTMYNIIGPISLSALSVGTYTHIGCGMGRVTDTAAGGTHTAFPAERRLAPPPVAIMFVAKMQRRLLSAESGYFKWHCCMSKNRVWFHSLFKEWNKFGEYHHALGALWRRQTKYF